MAQRAVCRQVVAGPRFEPTTHQGARERGRRLPWWPAPSLIARRSERPAVPGLQVPPSETDASGARASCRELDGADRGAGSRPTWTDSTHSLRAQVRELSMRRGVESAVEGGERPVAVLVGLVERPVRLVPTPIGLEQALGRYHASDGPRR